MSKNKTSPYDFFLNLLSVGLLYFSVGALVSVAFSVINNLFPDPIGDYYENIVSSWSLAVLLILFPVYVWTVRRLKTSIEKEPKKEEARSRRWMINFTIFIAAIIILGSFVSIVFRFLEGELTVRFLSKAILMLIISGVVIGFYRDFLRLEDNKRSKRMKVVSIAAVLLVVLVVISGFWFSDSPFDKRSIRIDQERIQDLNNLQSAIYEDWRATGSLPSSLEEISSPWFSEDTFYDPITGEMYGYNVLDERNFELCATFDTESSDHLGYYHPRPYPGGDVLSNNWNHTIGMNCFERFVQE